MHFSTFLSTLVLIGTLLWTSFRLHRNLLQRPTNDKCSTATAILGLSFNATGIDTSMAIPDVHVDTKMCHVAASDVGVWYTFLGNQTIVQAKLSNPTFHAKITVFSGSCGALLCTEHVIRDSCGAALWPAMENVTYFILVSGCSQSKGSFDLQIAADENIWHRYLYMSLRGVEPPPIEYGLDKDGVPISPEITSTDDMSASLDVVAAAIPSETPSDDTAPSAPFVSKMAWMDE